MSTLSYCAKQATAMAEFETGRAKAKLDDAIESEESREEMIAARAEELILKRKREMSLIDIVAGLQSASEHVAAVMNPHLVAGDMHTFGVMCRALINLYIEQDSETMAQEWMLRIDREVAAWGN